MQYEYESNRCLNRSERGLSYLFSMQSIEEASFCSSVLSLKFKNVVRGYARLYHVYKILG